MTPTAPAATTTIRPATAADVPRLVALGCAQLEATYAGLIPANPAQLDTLMTSLVTTPTCVVFVAEQAGAVIGMIGVSLSVHHASGVLTATEVMWWMDPAARGRGVALLTRAERWAAEHGARQIQLVAPAQYARVGRLYERRGYQMLETGYQAPVTPAMTALTIWDDVLPDADAYRAVSRQQPFATVEPTPGAVFHGIAPPVDARLLDAMAARWPGLTPTLTVLRQSPAGQPEPHFIHTDVDMGDWSALYYLTEAPAAGDGTLFWRWHATGAIRSLAPPGSDWARAECAAWTDLPQWEPWTFVEARPNRLVVFPATYYHSRALVANYGEAETARLVQVVFGTGAWPPEGAG